MQRKTRFVPVLIRKDESGLKPWLDIERWFQTFTLESAEGGTRRTPFADVRGCPSRGFQSWFASIHVWGCLLPVVGVPVKIPVNAVQFVKCGEYVSEGHRTFGRHWLSCLKVS
jgi:hypothetical protein